MREPSLAFASVALLLAVVLLLAGGISEVDSQCLFMAGESVRNIGTGAGLAANGWHSVDFSFPSSGTLTRLGIQIDSGDTTSMQLALYLSSTRERVAITNEFSLSGPGSWSAPVTASGVSIAANVDYVFALLFTDGNPQPSVASTGTRDYCFSCSSLGSTLQSPSFHDSTSGVPQLYAQYTTCSADTTCVNGVCECDSLSCNGRCSGTVSNVCSSMTCPNTCGTDETCIGGTTCTCDSLSCAGRCGDTVSNACNSTTCPNTCGADETCIGGTTCTCGFLSCAGRCGGTVSNACNSTLCPNTCSADETCTGGTTCTCDSLSCAGRCGGTVSNACNSTMCPNTCDADETCIGGTKCTCDSLSCAGRCGGTVSNGCNSTACPNTCGTDEVCRADGSRCLCMNVSCTDRCGNISNACGNQLSCRTDCSAGASCQNTHCVVPMPQQVLSTSPSSDGGDGLDMMTVIGIAAACSILCIATALYYRFGRKRSSNDSSRPDETEMRQPGSVINSGTSTPAVGTGIYSPLFMAASPGGHKAFDPSGTPPAASKYGGGDSSNSGSQSRWSILASELVFEQQIGAGSYGIVYKGKWRNQTVAVKMVKSESGSTNAAEIPAKQLQEFEAEAALMAGLRPHENICQLLGMTTTPNMTIVTEFCDNGSLDTYIRTHGLFDCPTVYHLVRGMASGLAHLHRENVVHRDLAARNVLLTSSMTAKLADFGMSRVLDQSSNDGAGQTKSDTGPLKWMAPESISMRQYSPYSDVWSFGVVLYESVVGDEPYPELKPIQAAMAVSQGQISPKLPLQTSETYPFIQDTIDWCCVFNVNTRPDMQAVVDHVMSF